MYLLWFLSEREFDNVVRSDMIFNFPVTFDDVKNPKIVFGPDFTLLKGKPVRCKPVSIVIDYVDIPREILKSRKELEVSTDVMFVNKLPFLVSIIRGMKFTTIEYLSSDIDIELLSSINKIVSYYKSHGLHVGMMYDDPEF